ncbi:MAG: hypothetical protein ABR586_03070, partial [Thermoplasmatota archaeon]
TSPGVKPSARLCAMNARRTPFAQGAAVAFFAHFGNAGPEELDAGARTEALAMLAAWMAVGLALGSSRGKSPFQGGK